MPVAEKLLEILVCPEDKTAVTLIDGALIEKICERIRSGSLKDNAGNPVREEFKEGLIREDKKVLYPVRDDIPVMLIDERIELDEELQALA